MRWKLTRLLEDEHATIGCLETSWGQRPYRTIWTLELPERSNERSISRIPAGAYKITKLVDRARLRLESLVPGVVTFHETDLCERYAVDIHIANVTSELLGCIAVGWGITGSLLPNSNAVGGKDQYTPTLTQSANCIADIISAFNNRNGPVVLQITDPLHTII